MHRPTSDGSFIDEETGIYYDDLQTGHNNEATVKRPHNGYKIRKNKRINKSRTELSQRMAQKCA
jgi:hypothetical protein